MLQRDANFDGLIFYGVRSTKIYCRPTCPSRKPNRDRVCFFDSPQAEYAAAGYRACKRCIPQQVIAPDSTLAKVLAVCRYLDIHVEQIPTLAELGQQVGMSPTHLQRSFKQMISVTPLLAMLMLDELNDLNSEFNRGKVSPMHCMKQVMEQVADCTKKRQNN